MEIESAEIASSIMVLIFTISNQVLSIMIEDKHTIVVDDFIGLQKNEEQEKYFIAVVYVYGYNRVHILTFH